MCDTGTSRTGLSPTMANHDLRPSDDQRRYLRLRSFKSAQVLFGATQPAIDVRIIDMSSAGAQLELAVGHQLTDVFDLVIHPDDPARRKAVRCRLIWQRKTSIGVTFL